MKNNGVFEILALGVVGYFLLLTLPRVLGNIQATNAAIARQNSPGAAGDSALAGIITAGGNAGRNLVDQFGGFLLQNNPYSGEGY